MFTTHCFIRKNTPELRNKLQDMGYKQNIYDKNEYPWLAVNHSMFISVNKGFERLPEFNIDCGDNEELFLAIAALRDDTDKHQWFYSTGWTDFEGNPLPDKWVFCDQDTLEHFAWVNNSPNSYKTGWKKATVEELIEHFK